MSELQRSKSGNRIIPNSFQTPNFVVDELMYYLTPTETCCLIYAIRNILGWQDKIADRKADIAISSFQSAGLGQTATRTALKGLNQYHILIPVGRPSPRGQTLWLQDDETKIDWDGLKQRRSDRDATEVARTVQANLFNPNRVVSSDDRGSSDDRSLVSCDDRSLVSSDDNIKTQNPKPIFPLVGKVEAPTVDSLVPVSLGGKYLFERLHHEAQSHKPPRKGPKRFETAAQRDLFLQTEERLGITRLQEAIQCALVGGMTSRDRVIKYIAKFGLNGNGYHPGTAPAPNKPAPSVTKEGALYV